MLGFLIFLNILSHTVGLLNLFLLTLLYYRDRDSLYLREILFLGCFGLMIPLQILESFLTPEIPSWLTHTAGFLSLLGVGGGIFALPWYIHHLEGQEGGAVQFRFFFGLSALATALGLGVHLYATMGFADAGVWKERTFLGIYLVYISVVAYTLFLAGKAAVSHRSRGGFFLPYSETTRMALRMGLVTAVLLPLLFILKFIEKELPFLPDLNQFRILPVIYLLWSLMLLSLRIRTITTFPAVELSLDKDEMEKLCEKLAISPRESQVLKLLVMGKTYIQIAQELFISLATVKTHINRIYKKAGVASKVELIFLVKST